MNPQIIYCVNSMDKGETVAMFGNRMQAFEYSNWMNGQNRRTIVVEKKLVITGA